MENFSLESIDDFKAIDTDRSLGVLFRPIDGDTDQIVVGHIAVDNLLDVMTIFALPAKGAKHRHGCPAQSTRNGYASDAFLAKLSGQPIG